MAITIFKSVESKSLETISKEDGIKTSGTLFFFSLSSLFLLPSASVFGEN